LVRKLRRVGEFSKVYHSGVFFTGTDVIEKILKYLGLWLPERPPPPKANGPPIIPEPSHLPPVDDYVIDPDYPIENWMN